MRDSRGASLSPRGGSWIPSSPAPRVRSITSSPQSCRSTRRHDDFRTPRTLALGLYRGARRVLWTVRVAPGPDPEGRAGDFRGPTARAGGVVPEFEGAGSHERPGARHGF